MAIKFEKLQAGCVYYQRKREKMGNTTMSELCEWPVKIRSLDPERRSAVVVWNGNHDRPETWYMRELERLYDWSMYDEDVAKVTRGMLDNIQSARKKKAPKSRAAEGGK